MATILIVEDYPVTQRVLSLTLKNNGHTPVIAGNGVEALERLGAEGAEPFCRGEVAAALSEFVTGHGGTLGPADFAAYEAIERRPISFATEAPWASSWKRGSPR